jgi:GNAT superfamily N-acetyltransferase
MSSRENAPLQIRAVTPADLPHLVALNCAAYPDLIQDEVVWTEPQLQSHLVVFPEGQLLAESEGRPVGAISTLILHRGIDPLANHTWLGVTDNGYFVRHDPGGDTLYLADIYVHPDAWGRGVGRALYAALREMCRRLGLRRIVAGGRLWSYGDVAHLMTPEAYVVRVERGEMTDQPPLRDAARVAKSGRHRTPGRRRGVHAGCWLERARPHRLRSQRTQRV